MNFLFNNRDPNSEKNIERGTILEKRNMKQPPEKTNRLESRTPEEKAAVTPQTTKVLAVVNENAAFTSPLSYLRKKDFQVKLVHTLMDGLRELSEFKPDILLLSWNLKGTDIKKVHPLLTQKFSAICFILGEDDATRTTTSMLSSGLPNTILYPVGGVNLYNRIQTALGRSTSNVKNKDKAKRTRSKDKTLLGGVEYKRPKKSEIPPDTVWHIRVNSTNPANQIWETILYKAGKPQYFYYKGDRPPDKWLAGKDEVANDRAYLFMSEQIATADILSSFHDYSEANLLEPEPEETEPLDAIDMNESFEPMSGDSVMKGSPSESKLHQITNQDTSGKDLSAKVAHSSPSKEMSIKSETNSRIEFKTQEKPVAIEQKLSPSGGPEDKLKPHAQTLLERSVNTAIELALKTEIKSFEAPIMIDAVSNLTVSVIKSSKFKGYLISGQANDVSNPNFMKKVFSNLNEEMRNQNEALSTLCGVLELKLSPVPFKKWTQERADFVVQSQLGNKEIVFAFIPAEDLPKNFIDEDLVPIPIETFEDDKVLYFDIYLHMPVNQKFVLYLKNGSTFRGISKSRLAENNVKVIYVKKADENLFFAYSARNTIERLPVNRSVPLRDPKSA